MTNIVHSAVTALLAVFAVSSFAQDARDRGFISKGMPEGEVVFRIGKPDHEAFIVNQRGLPEEKTWTYFPHPKDPQTLTIIRLRSGVVVEVERKVAR